MEILIGNRKIGLTYPPYFIADIAANHDGDIDRAFKLIELAKEAGADAAKFQNFKAEKIVSDEGFKQLGQLSHQRNWQKSVFEIYQDASVPADWTPLLKKKCDEAGIEYFTSPYDFDSVDDVDPYVKCYKIGSGDITWPDILKHIAQKNKPVLLATGASDSKEVARAVKAIKEINPALVLMQCNTNYTASAENFKYINLNVLNAFKKDYPDTVLGLSDHTRGFSAVLGAIALGARVIEKHFTDDNTRTGPDHHFSTTPPEWKQMVKSSLELYNALGDGIKRIEDNEIQTTKIQRRSIYVTKNLKEGEIITGNDIEMLRPYYDNGFAPYDIDKVLGKKCAQNLVKNSFLKRSDIRD
ncbi:N-acetylneuraminate synthase [Spirochaetia bacterium]|nr:N-acetylneuraminate synthase [Spirochaetia bacterium]